MGWPYDSRLVALVLLSLSLAILPAARTLASSRLRRLSTPAFRLGRRGTAATHPAMAPRMGVDLADADPTGRGPAVRRRALFFAALAGTAVLITFPSVGGGSAAVAVSAGSYLLLRGTALTAAAGSLRGSCLVAIRWPGWSVGRTTEADPTLPFAIDLLAVCLRAGMPTSSALRAVAVILSPTEHAGPRSGAASGVSTVLARAAAASELGSEAAAAWQDWVGHPVYGPLARALVVTGESGSAVSGRLEAVSQQLRSTASQQAMSRAQRAGVALMAPLGLCFLPAFVCLGVVPVVVGIAGRVFG